MEETTLSGIKETLKRAGATKEEVRDYLALTEPEARKQLLYRIRRKAFDECHEKQKTLDELDRACSACSILRASDGLWFRYRQRQERICRIGRRFGSTGKESK